MTADTRIQIVIEAMLAEFKRQRDLPNMIGLYSNYDLAPELRIDGVIQMDELAAAILKALDGR